MPKVKELSFNLKQQIMNACNSKMSFKTAAKQFSVSKSTVQYIKEYQETKTIATLLGRRHKPKLSPRL